MNEPKLTQEQMIMFAGALKNAKNIKCECGGEIFNQGARIKVLSRLLIGSDEDKPISIPTAYCIKCLKELKPEEEKESEDKEILSFDFKNKK